MAFLDIFLLNNVFQEEIKDEVERILIRNLRDVSDPFTIPQTRVKNFFRVSKELPLYLFMQLDPFMLEAKRSTYIPSHLKILLALNFYGYGSYQGIIGEDFNFSCNQPTVCRIIDLVTCTLMEQLVPQKIKFPTTEEEISNVKNGFLIKYGFPNVIGCIDGTHIAIISPAVEHELYLAALYFNRKRYTSINTLIICDSNLKIIAINARYPGFTHDAAIWQMSNICQHLRNKYFTGNLNEWLLGDSGYPLQPWLLTPIQNAPPGSAEARYVEAHIRIRNIIERLNGVLKSRFRCLCKNRALHYSPPKAGKISYACAALHNMCIDYNVLNDEILNDNEDNNDGNHNADPNPCANILHAGRRIRDNLIQTHFN